ncbi:MAG: hypothetical protein SGCHY_004514, partial [Lobulomycetales sp.]
MAIAQSFTDNTLARMKNSKLTEISGISRSSKDKTLWMHNDSGDQARIFAVDTSNGETVAEAQLRDVRAADFEDITFNDGVVFVGDIGDNARKRNTISIYRFDEPSLDTDSTVSSERFKFSYPGRKQNSEALMIDPISGGLFLISKESTRASLFEIPIGKSDQLIEHQVLKGIREAVTGADISQDGSEILVVGMDTVFLFERRDGESVVEAMTREPKNLGTSVKG